jgi:hypothetical protein
LTFNFRYAAPPLSPAVFCYLPLYFRSISSHFRLSQRSKDGERVRILREAAKLDTKLLADILRRHQLRSDGNSGRSNTGASQNLCRERIAPVQAGESAIPQKSESGNSTSANDRHDPAQSRRNPPTMEWHL